MTISKEKTPMPSAEEFFPSNQNPMAAEELVRLGDIYAKGGPEALEAEFRRLQQARDEARLMHCSREEVPVQT